MKERYRVEHYPSWVEEKMSSSKALRRKKKSLWSWAPIRAIAKIGQQQFYCVFSIFVQMIDGLPSSLDSLQLVVQLERKSKVWQTMPSRVFQRIAEFDETLHIETTIFGRESNMQVHMLKFMPKDYILSVIAVDAPEHFLFNRHRIDLSRLLPTSVEGFWEPDKPMSSTASFKLGGKAEGAALVATFDFEVLNEEFRLPSLLIDGNASARFNGSSIRRVSRAVKSLQNSPNPSPYVKRSNCHFTSPCRSDVESIDSACIEKFELDSSGKESEKWSAHDYSSSDDERYQALRNDPLYLDSFGETEPAALSPSIKSQEGLGSLDGFSGQSHLANLDCIEKAEAPLFRRTKSDTAALSHQIDAQITKEGGAAYQSKQENGLFDSHIGVQVLESYSHLGDLAPNWVEKIEIPSARRTKSEILNGQFDVQSLLSCLESKAVKEVKVGPQWKQENNKSSPENEVEILESNSVTSELAADKFCINVETVESSPTTGLVDMMGSNERVEGSHFTGGIMLSPSFVRSRSFDSNREVLTVEEVVAFSEVNEKHMLCEGVQAFSFETSPSLKGAEAITPQSVSFTTLESQVEREVCVETHAESNFEVAAQHIWKDVGLESGRAERFKALTVSVNEIASTPSENNEDVEVDIFPFGAGDEELSFEANVVAEHFLDFLEREKETEPSFSEAVVQEVIPNPSPYAQDDMDLYVSTPGKAKLNVSPHCPQGRVEAFNHVKPTEEASENRAAETSFEDDLGLLSIIEAAESEMKKAIQTQRSKERAKMLEDAETKALMEKWGLTDEAFESSSSSMLQRAAPHGRQMSGSTSITRLKDGGSLKVMSLDSFQPCSNLVMQASRPVVIPTKASPCVVDILGSMASQGLENMTVQAFRRMPLADITGLSMEQFVASETIAEDGGHNYSSTISPSRQGFSFQGHTKSESSAAMNGSWLDLEEVNSVDDLAHTALRKIEPLAIEGLKVQCNMSKAAPDSLHIESLASRMSWLMPDVIHTPLHLHDGAHTEVSSAKSLLDMAFSAEDWLPLCGVKKLGCEASEKDDYSKGDDVLEGWGGASGGDNLTVAMLLQLRDPQRYYEPVGASMMALVQAERIKNLLGCRSRVLENESVAASNVHGKQGADELHGRGELKITGVHVAGVESPDDITNKPWGNKEQLQSGARWLVANSRANKSRHALCHLSTQGEAKAAKAGKAEILWSISACVHTIGVSWRDTEELCSYIRNPDLIFTADDTVSRF